ncbi:MAG: hypothetical protein AB1656_03265 [Candidatus Omnitrophota bacterium]
MKTANYEKNVFINCPFDDDYKFLFDALVFAVRDCGFTARCALEIDNAAQTRIDKIVKIVSECQWGIHDLSRTELDANNLLPRFNMPFELGIFLGATWFGDEHQREKRCLILDKEKYRYQKFCSDISGQDISVHDGNIQKAITLIRNWLQIGYSDKNIVIPCGSILFQRYEIFEDDLPIICKNMNLNEKEIIFSDFIFLIEKWLLKNDWRRVDIL